MTQIIPGKGLLTYLSVKLSPVMSVFKEAWKRFGGHLESYVKVAGDTPDTVLQKKIWWLLNITSAPILLFSILSMGRNLGDGVFYLNILFYLLLFLPLGVFHFYRRNIEAYALFSQLMIVTLTAIKVYLMGGMMQVGTPVYVGLIAPVYALILPNKKRAVYLFLFYTLAMMGATLANPYGPGDYLFYKYFMGFLISNSAIFFTLFYFTTQWEKAKRAEKDNLKELDALKTKFYTHIAHEFRTPLSIIGGISNQMKEQPEKWLEQGHEIIQRNCDNLTRLTDQLLDLSKLQDRSMPVHLVQHDIVRYLKYLVESFHSLADSSRIKLSFSAYPGVIPMDFDPDKIRDIVSNLLSNALKFTPAGGQVSVSLRSMQKEGEGYLRIRVRDTGTGISREELPRVFNQYFQAKSHLESNKVGSGLGLALTREQVKLLGGKICVRSTLGKGSVFEVMLPICNQAAIETPLAEGAVISEIEHANIEGTDPETSDTSKSKLQILVVEDNYDVVSYLRTLLEADYTIHTAANGADGLRRALKTIPDLIISDVMMPEMDGFTMTRKLKKDLRTSHIPVVLLTARADGDSKLEGLSSGADAYLAKPFSRHELFVRIKNLIELREHLQHRYASIEELPENFRKHKADKHLREDVFMSQVRRVLEAHLDEEEFGISALCKALAMSRSQLYRKFAALTDTTVNQYLQNLRLDKARELLRTTNLNVSEVAYDTGFKNPSHFSRAFSARYGYAPSQARAESPTYP